MPDTVHAAQPPDPSTPKHMPADRGMERRCDLAALSFRDGVRGYPSPTSHHTYPVLVDIERDVAEDALELAGMRYAFREPLAEPPLQRISLRLIS
jgi:hypothetical protein